MNKYGAKKHTVHGITFGSRREANRYMVLQDMVRKGDIIDLELQPVFMLIGAGNKPLVADNGRRLRYTADFKYIRCSDAVAVIEEVKGYKVRDYPLRKAIVRAMGIEITEV